MLDPKGMVVDRIRGLGTQDNAGPSRFAHPRAEKRQSGMIGKTIGLLAYSGKLVLSGHQAPRLYHNMPKPRATSVNPWELLWTRFHSQEHED